MEKLDRTCSICLHDRKQPKLLTCLHVYCFQCLFDYVKKSIQDGQFPCPLCRVEIQLPSGGVEEFQDFSEGDDVSGSDDVVDSNTETDDVSNMNDVAALTADGGLCDLCESQTIVKYRCKDCKQNICDSCKKIHSKLPLLKNHVIIDFFDGIKDEISEDSNHGNQNQQTITDTPVDLCSVHTSKPIEIHCVECKTSVCLQCYVDIHNGHRMLNLDNKDTQTKLRVDLKCLNVDLQAQIDRLQKFSDHLTSKLSEIDICSEEACNKVDQQVQLISKLVQSRADQIKTQINNTRHEERNKLEILREEMEISITELKSDIKDSLIALEGESVVKIVERNERNRNDEMKVKQKDLVVPDLQFPGFHPGSNVSYVVKKLVGEWENFNQPNFTLEFNINTISRDVEKKQDVFFNFGEFEWYVLVRCEDVGTLGVILCLTRDSMTNENKKVKVEYSFTILNEFAVKSRSQPFLTYEFKASGGGYGYGDFIHLEELRNPENGYVDKDGNFSIRILIQEMNEE